MMFADKPIAAMMRRCFWPSAWSAEATPAIVDAAAIHSPMVMPWFTSERGTSATSARSAIPASQIERTAQSAGNFSWGVGCWRFAGFGSER